MPAIGVKGEGYVIVGSEVINGNCIADQVLDRKVVECRFGDVVLFLRTDTMATGSVTMFQYV